MGQATILPYNYKKEERSSVVKNISDYIEKAGFVKKTNRSKILATIYFATNVSDPNSSDDRIALDSLAKQLTNLILIERLQIELDCIGSADFRAGETFNWNLGYSRALAVKEYIEKQFKHKNLIIHVKSVGEHYAFPEELKGFVTPKQLKNKLKEDRKVDIKFSNVEKAFKIAFAPINYQNKVYWENYFNSEDSPFSFTTKWTMDNPIVRSIQKLESDNIGLGRLPYSINDYVPTVKVTTSFAIRKVADSFIGDIECHVNHSASNSLLFLASEFTKEDIIDLYWLSGPGISRRIMNFSFVPKGAKIVKKKIPEWDIKGITRRIICPLYVKLCGSYDCISERAKHELNRLQIF